MINVYGRTEDDEAIVLSKDSELPEEFTAAVAIAVERNRPVGYPWWKAMPSLTTDEGFVAAAIWWLYRVDDVEGFDVPEPDPDLTY